MTENLEVPFLDLPAQYAKIKGEIQAALEDVLQSQRFILGPQVEAFESEMAELCGARFAVSCASGSDALLLALMVAGVRSGDRVVCPTYTFIATAGAIARLGAVPVFTDVSAANANMDGDCVREVLKRHSDIKAIVPVHLFGRLADMNGIRCIAQELAIPIVEDAAQAIGAREAGGEKVGSLADFRCFSFFPSKNLGGYGDGGLVCTQRESWANQIRALRAHGASRKYHHPQLGFNSRLDALQAAILRVKLRHLDSWNEQRRQNAQDYDRTFRRAEGLPLHLPPLADEPAEHVFNQYVVRVPEQVRDDLRSWLKERGIATEVYYPLPLHLQGCFRYLGHRKGDFPRAEAWARESLALPIYPELGDTRRKYVASHFIRGLRKLIASDVKPARRRENSDFGSFSSGATV